MNLTRRQQLLGILAITALALWACDRLVFTLLTQSWKARSTRIAELKKSFSQGRLLLERETPIRSRWETMRTNTLSSQASQAEGQVLKAFDRWSQDSRVGINSIRPQWRRNAEDHATLECRVDAFGSLSALTRFLYEIEKDPLALKVDSVEIAARDDSGEQLALALQVSGLLLSPQGIR
jgi:hypothetical protein